VDRQTADEVKQCGQVGGRVVDASEQQVFDHQALALEGRDGRGRRAQLRQRIAPGQRDELFALRLPGAVQAQGQAEARQPPGQAHHGGGDADR